MNRFIKSLLLALSFTMVISAVALAATWDFKYPTTATDNTSTTRTYYPVLLGYGGQQLIDNEKILSSGLDTNMQIGSTDVDYMMSTDNVLAIVPTLPSNGSVKLDLYTGYSPLQTGFPIIIGDGGYITVSDDPSMEMGDNCTLTITNAQLNSDNGSNKNFWYKEDAIKIAWDETTSGKVNVTIYEWDDSATWNSPTGASGTSWSNASNCYDDNTGTYAYYTIPSLSWSGYLTMTNTAVVTDRVRTYCQSQSDISQILVDVYYSAGWHNIYSGAKTQGNWQTHTIGSFETVSSVRIKLYNNNGGSSQTGYFNECDINLAEAVAAVTTSVSGLSDDEADVILTLDTTDVTIDIGGSSNSTALGGVSVLDNDNDIIMMQGNSFVKADSIELEIDGVVVATYAPTEILSGTTLVDETGSNDGTITWGSNTGVEITYGAMESSIESEGGSPVTGNATLPKAFMPATWFAMGENVEDLPFYDMVYNVANALDFPDVTEGVQTLYLIVIYGTSLMAFLLIVLFTRSALLGFSAMEIVLFVGSSMTIIPMWIPVAILLVGIAIMFLYRQVAY